MKRVCFYSRLNCLNGMHSVLLYNISMKYPAVYVYKSTDDRGLELKHSLRSLKNLKNFNGEVFVVGDSESWFSNKITYIKAGYDDHSRCCSNRQVKCYYGELYNWKAAAASEQIPGDFILMNDDFFITKPVVLRNMVSSVPLYRTGHTRHMGCKRKTSQWLTAKGYTDRNFELHIPMIVNKAKLAKVHELMKHDNIVPPVLLQRSLYGNLYLDAMAMRTYIDQKIYHGDKIGNDPFVSTNHYIKDLANKFRAKSVYEKATARRKAVKSKTKKAK